MIEYQKANDWKREKDLFMIKFERYENAREDSYLREGENKKGLYIEFLELYTRSKLLKQPFKGVVTESLPTLKERVEAFCQPKQDKRRLDYKEKKLRKATGDLNPGLKWTNL